MTFTNLTDTGNGPKEYVLVIEGFDYSFATNYRLANLASTPKIIDGLISTGLRIQQNVVPTEAKLKLNSNNFEIVDYQDQATKCFYRQPTFQSQLQDNISRTDTVMQVLESGGLSIGDYLWMGPETLRVVSLPSSNTIEVARAQLGSTAIAHEIQTQNNVLIKPPVQNTPFTITQRRAYLYGYSGNDSSEVGTIVWRGVILGDPDFKGESYTIEVGPITEILQSEIGVDATDLKLFGLNFGPWSWVIRVDLLDSVKIGNDNDPIASIDVTVEGFFSSVQVLRAFINEQLISQTNNATWNTRNKPGCVLSYEGELLFTQKSADANPSTCIRFSTLNAPMQYVDSTKGTVLDYFNIDDRAFYIYNSAGAIQRDSKVKKISSSVTYAQRLINTTFPKQLTIYSTTTSITNVNNFSNSVYGKRFYLDYYSLNSTLNNLVVNDADGKLVAQTITGDSYYVSVNEEERFVETNLYFYTNPGYFEFIIIDNDHSISLATSYGLAGLDSVRNPYGNWVGFLEYLISVSPDNIYNGFCPLITLNDFDIADMKRVYDTLSPKSFQTQRSYLFSKKTAKLEQIMAEELKLLGCYPCLTSEGKITMRQIKNVNPLEEMDYVVDSDDILTDKGYPTYVTNKFGIVNSVILNTVYNSVEDKWQGTTWVRNNTDSIAQSKAKSISIKPYSNTNIVSAQEVIDFGDWEDILYRLTSLFCKPYRFVTIEVPFKHYGIEIGATVRIKNKQLPNLHPDNYWVMSRRGSAKYIGTVLEKNFDFGTGFGSLGILISDEQWALTDKGVKAVYAPDLITETISSIGATFYNIAISNVSSSLILQPNTTLKDLWSINDGIRFDQYNSTTNNEGGGKIVAINGTGNNISLVVSMSTTPTNFTGSTQFYGRTSDYNYLHTTDEQKLFGFYDGATVRFEEYYTSPSYKLVFNDSDQTLNRVISN